MVTAVKISTGLAIMICVVFVWQHDLASQVHIVAVRQHHPRTKETQRERAIESKSAKYLPAASVDLVLL